MEDAMLFLSVDSRWDAQDVFLNGICSHKTAERLSFQNLLGLELIARTKGGDLLDTCKSAFAVLAALRNDDAAEEAFRMVYELTLTTRRSSPYDSKLSVEVFREKQRHEECEFLDWLETMYWSLPLYQPGTITDPTTDEGYFCLDDKLKKTKSAIFSLVAGIWSGKTDEVAVRALGFLCDCYDDRRFAQKAKSIVDVITEYHKKHSFGTGYDLYRFRVPKEDADKILAAIRTAMPTKLGDILAAMGESRGKVPVDVWRLFGHAFVNAGGELAQL